MCIGQESAGGFGALAAGWKFFDTHCSNRIVRIKQHLSNVTVGRNKKNDVAAQRCSGDRSTGLQSVRRRITVPIFKFFDVIVPSVCTKLVSSGGGDTEPADKASYSVGRLYTRERLLLSFITCAANRIALGLRNVEDRDILGAPTIARVS
jgi:hypothetical protein